eukprot:s1031_g31.t1
MHDAPSAFFDADRFRPDGANANGSNSGEPPSDHQTQVEKFRYLERLPNPISPKDTDEADPDASIEIPPAQAFAPQTGTVLGELSHRRGCSPTAPWTQLPIDTTGPLYHVELESLVHGKAVLSPAKLISSFRDAPIKELEGSAGITLVFSDLNIRFQLQAPGDNFVEGADHPVGAICMNLRSPEVRSALDPHVQRGHAPHFQFSNQNLSRFLTGMRVDHSEDLDSHAVLVGSFDFPTFNPAVWKRMLPRTFDDCEFNRSLSRLFRSRLNHRLPLTRPWKKKKKKMFLLLFSCGLAVQKRFCSTCQRGFP